MVMLLPKPPDIYDSPWMNQYTRVLEMENQQLRNALQQLQLFIAPSFTTAQKLTLDDKPGRIILDTTLGKLCFNTGSGWETVTSVP